MDERWLISTNSEGLIGSPSALMVCTKHLWAVNRGLAVKVPTPMIEQSFLSS